MFVLFVLASTFVSLCLLHGLLLRPAVSMSPTASLVWGSAPLHGHTAQLGQCLWAESSLITWPTGLGNINIIVV